MKKTLKKLVATAMLVVSVVSTTLSVSATESAWLEAPATTAGSWSSRTTAVRCYAAAETVKKEHTYFKYDESSLESLPSSFVSSSSREMSIKFMELDSGNDDDLIRTYIGKFKQRKLSGIYANTYYTGDLEGEGDNGAELYIKIYVNKLSGDPTVPSIASGLFEFKVGAN